MVVTALLALPASLVGPTRAAFLRKFATRLPSIPLMPARWNKPAATPGDIQIAPCLVDVANVSDAVHARGGFPSAAHTVNHEAVETYSIWPYQLFSAHSNVTELAIGRNTQRYRRCVCDSTDGGFVLDGAGCAEPKRASGAAAGGVWVPTLATPSLCSPLLLRAACQPSVCQ